ncbi:MAG: nicotinate-nucleotide adenylyltransferase [Ruminococcaceae bacterium]|nr:nicotinate-nucleotide adenylyltransferase [Oscillospiraceae bacterium]
MKKIGIMGGTFNPIHIGHLILADRAKDDFGLDEVWIIPTGCSYMKKDIDVLPGEERYHMVLLAAKDKPWMKCLDVEIKHSGYTYSYETLEQLKETYPENEFYFIFGADCLFSIECWKCPERIFDACQVIAAVRNDSSTEEMQQKKIELEQKFGAKIELYSFPRLEISSTELRERIRLGKSVSYMIPEQVISYIAKKGFYKEL